MNLRINYAVKFVEYGRKYLNLSKDSEKRNWVAKELLRYWVGQKNFDKAQEYASFLVSDHPYSWISCLIYFEHFQEAKTLLTKISFETRELYKAQHILTRIYFMMKTNPLLPEKWFQVYIDLIQTIPSEEIESLSLLQIDLCRIFFERGLFQEFLLFSEYILKIFQSETDQNQVLIYLLKCGEYSLLSDPLLQKYQCRYCKNLERINHQLAEVQQVFFEEMELNGNLKHNYKILQEQIQLDSLTNCYNRSILEAKFQCFCHHFRSGIFLFMDIDNLKKINDSYGHYVGDAALKTFSEVFFQYLTDEDLFIRYAGDEFILITHREREMVVQILFEIEKRLETALDLKGQLLPIQFTYGMIDICQNNTLECLFNSADEAMYTQKKRKKNCKI